jgi:hypothetical protein
MCEDLVSRDRCDAAFVKFARSALDFRHPSLLHISVGRAVQLFKQSAHEEFLIRACEPADFIFP